MSMIGNFLLVKDAEIDDLLRSPEGIHALLEARAHGAGESEDYVDVEKAWHGLHFLLTGTAWEGEAPLNFIVSGGASIGDEDVGYGPARALRSHEVVALADALGKIPAGALVDRYDGQKMDSLEIYPRGWTQYDPRREDFGYYTGAYEDIVALVRKGAASKRGLLIWVD